jgi:glycosyltransferase involved in cell wall biosynthesis
MSLNARALNYLPAEKAHSLEWQYKLSSSAVAVSLDAPRQKPSVLFITPSMPLLSGKGGAMRAGMHIQGLSKIFDVHVLVLARFGIEPDFVPEPELQEKMASLKVVEVLMHMRGYVKSRQTNVDVIRHFFVRPRPAAAFPKEDIAAILKALASRKFDCIFFGRLSTGVLMENADFRKWVGKTPRVLDIDDIESETSRREAKTIGLKKGRAGHLNDIFDAFKLSLIESRVFKRFDQVLVCSDHDREKIAARHPKTSFGVLPNGFQVPATRAERTQPSVLTLLFVGSLNYAPNTDGILFFCKEVLPRIRRRLDVPFRLLIVGRNPTKAVHDLDRLPEVTVVGTVPDVTPYYQSATLAIAPIRFGGGTRIKILEAMALGCPVVATTLGAEGLDVTDGENILIADQADAMADACVWLAQNPILQESLSQSGWETVKALYSPDAVAQKLADCIKTLPLETSAR